MLLPRQVLRLVDGYQRMVRGLVQGLWPDYRPGPVSRGVRSLMPYKSAKQRAYLHIHEPALAAKWDKKYGGKVKAAPKKKAKKK